ncbi:MAG TPA: phospho-N-acetylmuramoyl-pentapeptide-transferase [Candidatus Eremiobacteraceae bacterium]
MCNGDYVASHYVLFYGFNLFRTSMSEWVTLFTIVLIGWVVAREVISTLIRVQRSTSVGQQVYESGPAAHLAKQGTPTMGGIAFPIAAVVAAAYLTAEYHYDSRLLLMVGLVASVAAIGFVDDYLSIKRRTSLGLRARSKMLLLIIVAAVAAHGFLDGTATDCAYSLTTGNDQWWFGRLLYLPISWYYILAIAAVVGCANAVNLTDGVDGLAGSVALPPLVVLSFLDGGGIGIAVATAVVVFLFYNRYPAKVFMGDTGSLTLGALLAFLAIKEHLLLFLPLLGIVFVVEALSVIAQVISFKLTGKRIFKMSPLHHHFELSGWSEQRVTRTFALVSLFAAVVFCAIVYYSNVRMPGT